MQRGHLHVPVQHLSEEPSRQELRCAALAIGLDEFTGEIVVEVAIRRVDQRLLLQCIVRGTAEATCDRCAEPFTGACSAEYSQWYVIGGHPGEDSEEDAYAITQDQRDVVIDDDVREQMLIALPMKRLCREDCLGLCPRCGRNRNLDPCSCEEEEDNPMWAGLKDVHT